MRWQAMGCRHAPVVLPEPVPPPGKQQCDSVLLEGRASQAGGVGALSVERVQRQSPATAKRLQELLFT